MNQLKVFLIFLAFELVIGSINTSNRSFDDACWFSSFLVSSKKFNLVLQNCRHKSIKKILVQIPLFFKNKKSISDSTVLSSFYWPIILGFSYKHYLVLQTDKLNVGGKKTTSKNSHNKHGQFPTCRHPIMENISTWIQEESPGFPKRHFGLFHGNSTIKRRPLKPSGACYHFSLKKKVSPKKQYPS